MPEIPLNLFHDPRATRVGYEQATNPAYNAAVRAGAVSLAEANRWADAISWDGPQMPQMHQGGGFFGWLQANQTLVLIGGAALFGMVMLGGRR